MRYLFLLLLTFSVHAEVYSVKSTLPYIAQTAKVANCILKNEKFLNEVKVYPKFTFTKKSPVQVYDALKSMRPVTISTYKTKLPWSAAIATTYKNDKSTVYFNTRKNPRPIKEMVNTALHEGLHLQGFSHGDNSPKGKEQSVNYAVGSIAEKYVEDCK